MDDANDMFTLWLAHSGLKKTPTSKEERTVCPTSDPKVWCEMTTETHSGILQYQLLHALSKSHVVKRDFTPEQKLVLMQQ